MEVFAHEISPIIISIRFSIIIGSVLVSTLLAKVVSQMELAIIAQENVKYAQQLLALQSTQYETLAKNIEQTRRAKHDLRHQLATIHSMCERKDYAQLQTYVEQYLASVQIDSQITVCENLVANSVICHYLALAKAQEIGTLDIKCALANACGIEDIDLCIILGNLLENAIEGCKTLPMNQRIIKLRMQTYLGELMLTIENTFDGFVQLDGNNYSSRKRKSDQKGVGLSSVASVVNTYGGKLRCEHDNHWFHVSIRIKL